MATSEYAAIVIAEGGRDAISHLVEAWEGDPDETAQHIVEAGKAAIISMDALHRINQSFGKSGGAGSTHRKMVFNAGTAAGGESKSQAQRLAEDKAEQEQLQQQFQNLKIQCL